VFAEDDAPLSPFQRDLVTGADAEVLADFFRKGQGVVGGKGEDGHGRIVVSERSGVNRFVSNQGRWRNNADPTAVIRRPFYPRVGSFSPVNPRHDPAHMFTGG
jgi:hypothetical protein